MQDFGTKANDTAGPSGQLTAEEFNNLALELENSVLRSGQALNGASVTQIATSIFLHSVKSGTFQDSGAANAYIATPISGSGGVLLPADYANMDGAIVLLKASNANSGASTLNIGQTTGTLLGAKAIVDQAGAILGAGAIAAGAYISLRYDASIGAGSWVLLTPSSSFSAVGNIRMQAVSATSIRIVPYNGNSMVIGGARRQVPSAGVSLTNGGMNINTLYYIYAFWNGTSISLEFSTIGHSTDTATGVEIKTGDATRSLVGMVRTNASAQFVDGPTSRLVASWFNRRNVSGSITTTGTLTYSNTGSPAEISTAVRLLFLNWGDEAVAIRLEGQLSNNTATQSSSVQSYVDGSTYGTTSAVQIPSANAGHTFSSGNSADTLGVPLAEGFHTAAAFGNVTSGTGATNFMSHSLVTRI